MPRIKELIKLAGEGAEELVSAAKPRYLDQVRGVLRDLTRLKFSERQGVESQHISLQIKISPGLPKLVQAIADQEIPTDEQLGIENIGL
jgi:hypothetical protein